MIAIITRLLGAYLNFINLISKRIGGKQAFYVFCYPFKAKLSAKQQEYLGQAKRTNIALEKGEYPLYTWGSGKQKLLFVHGWQSNAYRWRRFIDQLDKEKYTDYAFDAPGHGNSTSAFGNVPLFAKAIHKIIEHVGPVENMITHSIGGFASLYFCHLYPDLQPQKIVCLASPSRATDFVDVYAERLNLSDKTIKNMESYFTGYAGKPPSYFDIKNLLGNVVAEGLIIHDEDDRDVNIENARRIHKYLKNSTLKITKGLGHRLINKNVTQDALNFAADRPINIQAKANT